jgi:dTDP-4-dehydrorhamnose 3,5-epimerase
VQIERLAIPDVLLLTPKRHGDARGWFREAWSATRFAEAGLDHNFVQDNEAFSADAGTLRGLHFQAPPAAQSKLVSVLRGRVFDVVVDLRVGSASFGRHVCCELSAEHGASLMVPRGFAHGYLTLEPATLVAYKVDAPYAPALEGGIAWDDPDTGISWPTAFGAPVLSDKDRALPRLSALASPFWVAA